MKTFTKQELQTIYQSLGRILPPGGQPLTDPAEIVIVNQLRAKTAEMITTALSAVERGPRLAMFRLHGELAPTLNELAAWNARSPWRVARAKKRLVDEVNALVAATPGLDLVGAQKQRWVRVTRWTARPTLVDDDAIDQIGGKFVIDMLKKAGVFVDDSPRWLVREAGIRKTKNGNLHLQVEIFECSEYQVWKDEPEAGDAPPDPFPKKQGPTTKHVRGEKPAAALPAPSNRSLPFGGDS